MLFILPCTFALKHTVLNQTKQNAPSKTALLPLFSFQSWKVSLHCLRSILLCPLHQEKAADELQTFFLWAVLKSGSVNEQPFDSSEHTAAWTLFSLTLCQAYYTCLSSQGNRRITISIWLLLLLSLIFAGFEIQQWFLFYFSLSFCHFPFFFFFLRKRKENNNKKLIQWNPFSLQCFIKKYFFVPEQDFIIWNFFVAGRRVLMRSYVIRTYGIALPLSVSTALEGEWQRGMCVWREAVAIANRAFLCQVSRRACI